MGWTVALGLPLGLARPAAPPTSLDKPGSPPVGRHAGRNHAFFCLRLGNIWTVCPGCHRPDLLGLHEARPGLIHLGLGWFCLDRAVFLLLCGHGETSGRAASLHRGSFFSWEAGCWKRPADACWPGSKRVRHEALDQRSGGRRRAGGPGCFSAANLPYDRVTRPRVWVLTAPFDPNLPIRGRYVRLQLVVEPRGIPEKKPGSVREPGTAVILQVEGDKLVAARNPQELRYDPAELHVNFTGPK